MRNKVPRTAFTGAVLLLALAACGRSNVPSQGEPAGDSVRVAGFLFKPEKLTVSAGTTVEWMNADDIEHTVTSGTPEALTAVFDSGNKAKGETFSHVFPAAGAFTYFCRNHTGMRGEVAVT